MAKFYVSWREREILTERERDERIEMNVCEMLEESFVLDEFLNSECTLVELFHMTQEDREDLQERFRAWAELKAEEGFEEEFEEYDTAYFQ